MSAAATPSPTRGVADGTPAGPRWARRSCMMDRTIGHLSFASTLAERLYARCVVGLDGESHATVRGRPILRAGRRRTPTQRAVQPDPGVVITLCSSSAGRRAWALRPASCPRRPPLTATRLAAGAVCPLAHSRSRCSRRQRLPRHPFRAQSPHLRIGSSLRRGWPGPRCLDPCLIDRCRVRLIGDLSTVTFRRVMSPLSIPVWRN